MMRGSVMAFVLSALSVVVMQAHKYEHNFRNTPISQALVKVAENPDVNLSFIYKDLDNYTTSARISTDNIYEAVRMIVGLNPISVVCKDGCIYVEALQHGRYFYTGSVIGSDGEPVAAATVMLLAPTDSIVITYGITDGEGHFRIPCDHNGIIGKISCMGYKTKYRLFAKHNVGVITIDELPINLATVTVEGSTANLYSDKSVYLPTKTQKKSAQTAQDLIQRMAIPQLAVDEDIKTNTGQQVDIYIDYVPATGNELTGILVSDVKRVEYYDYPSDPRFQGKSHVVNFVMQRYEYGGYAKGIYYDNFVMSRQLNGYSKLQYKRMTFDVAGGLFFMRDKKYYEDTYETYRLPQPDGTIKEIQRNSIVDNTKKTCHDYWASFKAMYKTDKVTMSNMFSVEFNRTPKYTTDGHVSYSSEEYEGSEYSSLSSNRINSFAYNGYWYFALPGNNTITFNPRYAYTNTQQNSRYEENGAEAIVNGAKDNSHQAVGDIAFVHSFGKVGTLKVMCQGRFLLNKTRYSGSSSVSDKAQTLRFGPGVNYSYTGEKLHSTLSIGLNWDRSEYGTTVENTTAPWADLAVQCSINKKNSFSVRVGYRKSIPSSGYRSAAVIQSNPLMSYTGNPSLVPYKSFDADGNYTFIINKAFKMAAYANVWVVDNRYVYDYQANDMGVLRTIKQPLGGFAQWQYGVQGTGKFFKDNLQVSLSGYMLQGHNGAPYNWNKGRMVVSASAFYYLKDFYFGATYRSPMVYPDGCMIGMWMDTRSNYTLQVGWSNDRWNFRFYTRNPFYGNTYATKSTTQSRYYDSIGRIYTGSYIRFFQISATYTFGYGKKVKAGNEAYKADGASSGILNK